MKVKYFACVSQFNRSNLYYIISIKINLFLIAELSSQLTLRELFPELNGEYLPPIRTFKYVPTRQLVNLRKIVDHGEMTGFDARSTLVARSHVIVGWLKRDVIKPISNLFGETNNVFDTLTNKFVDLLPAELQRLGLNRRLSFVRLHDVVFSVIRPIPQTTHEVNQQVIHPANHTVNQQAIHQANHQLKIRPNHQEYQTDQDYFGKNEAAAVRRPTSQVNHQVNIEANHKAFQVHQDYLKKNKVAAGRRSISRVSNQLSLQAGHLAF